MAAGGPAALLARLIVLFWAAYFTLIAVTNAVDLLDSVGAIHTRFLNSGNFAYLRSVVRVYHVGSIPTILLLAAALAIESLGAALFWRALRRADTNSALHALCWGAAVWIAFIAMTELFVAYTAEAPFRELLLLTIASATYLTLGPRATDQRYRIASA